MEKTSTIESKQPSQPPSTVFWSNIPEDIWAVIIAGIFVTAVLVWSLSGANLPVAPVYQWSNGEDFWNKVIAPQNITTVLLLGLFFGSLSSAVVYLTGGSFRAYWGGFTVVFALAILSLVVAGNKQISSWGLEYVVFALVFGLILGNFTKVPTWLQSAARSEFFIKTGLVILGTSILFKDIVQAGFPGLLQSVAVVSVVWFFSMWLSRRFKVDDEFGVILASAVSICGVSAAIVAAGAIQGDKKKLSYVTTLVLLVAVPMMVLQPWLIKVLHIPEIVGGAWLGGTLDTTASVAAAAQLVGPTAVKAGVIVKFSQNVLIGIAAFFITTWWVLRNTNPSEPGADTAVKPGFGVVWERFPKFVLGFIAASLLFSFLIPGDTVKQVSGLLNSFRTLWFALAFVAIGLEARFTDLVKIQGGRPALVFVGAQVFNIFWTLLWSYLLFGGVLFSAPDIQ